MAGDTPTGVVTRLLSHTVGTVVHASAGEVEAPEVVVTSKSSPQPEGSTTAPIAVRTASDPTAACSVSLPFMEEDIDTYIQPRGLDAHVLGEPSVKKLSRRLCFVLRWEAKKLDLPITCDGYVKVRDIRALLAFNTCTEAKVRKVVRRDSKRRFGIMVTDDGELWVRANHGHGIPGVAVVEREFSVRDMLGYVVHASSLHAWSLIRYEGLKRLTSA